MSVAKFIALISFVIFGCLYSIGANAQAGNFIHFQSENNNAFTVQWNGNTYSSSASGYLIIPQVPVGEQVMVFGFQDTSLPANSFTISMDDKPHGFTLKQSISNSWSLFDMVSFSLTKGTEMAKQKEEKPAFIAKNPASPESRPLPPVTDTLVKPSSIAQPVVILDKPTAIKLSKTNEPPIQKIFEKANTYGIDQVYIVSSKGKVDTVAIFIPALKEELPKQLAMKTGADPRNNFPLVHHMVMLYTERIKSFIK